MVRQDYARKRKAQRARRMARHTGQRPPVAAAVVAGMGVVLALVGAGALALSAAAAAIVLARWSV